MGHNGAFWQRRESELAANTTSCFANSLKPYCGGGYNDRFAPTPSARTTILTLLGGGSSAGAITEKPSCSTTLSVPHVIAPLLPISGRP